MRLGVGRGAFGRVQRADAGERREPRRSRTRTRTPRAGLPEGPAPGLPQATASQRCPTARKPSVAQVLLMEPDRQLAINNVVGEKMMLL